MVKGWKRWAPTTYSSIYRACNPHGPIYKAIYCIAAIPPFIVSRRAQRWDLISWWFFQGFHWIPWDDFITIKLTIWENTWIFQLCKICVFSPKKPTKSYISGRSRYVWYVLSPSASVAGVSLWKAFAYGKYMEVSPNLPNIYQDCPETSFE